MASLLEQTHAAEECVIQSKVPEQRESKDLDYEIVSSCSQGQE